MLEQNKIYLGDCLEVMKKIDDKSIDMVLCDLPYGTTNCRWDTVIPLKKLWEQYERIIKDNGAIVLFAQTPFDKVLGCSNLKLLRYEWIWEKTTATGHLNSKKMPMKAHENILVFYKSLPTYNPQKTYGHKPVNSYTKYIDTQNNTEIYGKVSKEMSGGGNTDRFPRDVQVFSTDKQKCKLHSTQKPVSLCEYLIKTYTNKGDLVLDNCIGSGTTAVSCIDTNRDYIGIENDEEIFNTAVNRVTSSKAS
ncbi:DNA-methyltransferase [Clostridium estertheticum]|uniref:DNA-methyltransferase n=1 Tax=Clostridium estertheticum TaxID=238834 RepID=UPI001C7CCE75|nr:site-specific DNA-methyltransferase [Clostridium estertheticum]MBX4266574.1 site-specific DNA-methyltransferase [Clostridium estertheticum]WLC88086.1 site-specific DNA-methyltransferase [Clostridium estertheticum]